MLHVIRWHYSAFAYGTHHAGCARCGYAESHATLLHVRAGDVQLDCRDVLQFVDACMII